MDGLYAINEEKLGSVRKQKLWAHDPKYFKRVKISPSASIKMMMHGQQGVEKGTKQNGKPVEVMGLLLGRPDTEDLNALVITDCYALPIEGFETKVIADDENVINYMIELGDALEITRKERFCGWYHTHPFDVDVNGHCFLSNTDVTTQLQWQRSEDPHGNPWLAIVIDPLYSLAKGRPEMMAFRVYPPEHNAKANETPDGRIVTDDRNRVELWGACWNRYYKLDIEYFMSALSQKTLGVLKNKFLWQNAFCQSASRSEGYVEQSAARASMIASSLVGGEGIHGQQHPSSSRGGSGGHSMVYSQQVQSSAAGAGPSSSSLLPFAQDSEQTTSSRSAVRKDKLFDAKGAGECLCLCAQVAKLDIFGRYCARRYGGQDTAAQTVAEGSAAAVGMEL